MPPNLYLRVASRREGRCGVHTVMQLTRLNGENAPNWATGAFGAGCVIGNLMSVPGHASTTSSIPLMWCVSWCCGGGGAQCVCWVSPTVVCDQERCFFT